MYYIFVSTLYCLINLLISPRVPAIINNVRTTIINNTSKYNSFVRNLIHSQLIKHELNDITSIITHHLIIYFICFMIPLQKVAFKLDISDSSGGNPESAG